MIDIVSGALLITGSAFALLAAIGVVRLPDLLSRMHAATKPQTLGLFLILAGLALRVHSVGDLTLIVVIIAFQMLTAPVSAHMIGRAAFRSGQVDTSVMSVVETPDD